MIAVLFLYGLAFFSMGIAIMLEGGRGSDDRLRMALRPLAAFGIVHGIHEWLEMFSHAGILSSTEEIGLLWDAIRLAVLAFSFLSLSAFGFSLLAPNLRMRRLSLLAPLVQVAIWGFGIFIFRERYSVEIGLWNVADVWTRYILGIPSAMAASVGLVVQQREFRHVGMAEFGRDSLIASVAFGWYGVIGQVFVRASRLPPSTFLNQELFFHWFGFPVQILRAIAAVVVAVSVIRFMRAFDDEIKRQIEALQTLRLQEAQRREILRGDLLRRVVAAQESERQRIARELHDETGQKLTAIGLGLQGVTASLNKDTDQAKKNLRKLQTMTAGSLDELQRLIADLRPSHLDDLGLPAALRWYVRDVKERTDLQIKIALEGEERDLSEAVNIALFRIAQEALTNVIKHAKAQSVSVKLVFGTEQVKVSIKDDGCGFDVNHVNTAGRRAWGLLGMRERAFLLGGE
ncbi:MAG: sensor histidine kinase, partial [Amylibacter sp.]